MAGPALDYVYRYPFESAIGAPKRAAQPSLRLATFTDDEVSPYFFEGRLRQPFQVARMLQGLVQLVRTRFFVHQAMLPQGIADPIITAHEDFLRFEVFSGCCSVYARLDLPPAAIDGHTLGQGTTNVDFGPSLVAALGKVRTTDQLDFAVGADEFALQSGANQAIEKRVQLPIRWLKSLVAVTTYGGRLRAKHEIPAAEATKFLRSIPRAKDHKSRWWIQRSGRSVRISHRPVKDAVQAGALNRLRVLEDLVRFADRLRIYGNDDVEASCWELDCGDARFSLMMTHDVWRGFSGEGQGLEALARDVPERIVRATRSTLAWQSVLDPGAMVRRALSEEQLEQGLAVLATQGQVGFDVSAERYFHRELPFDLEIVAKLQPRLRDARKLIADKRVAPASEAGAFEVETSNTIHIVRVSESGARCTCPWYAKHKNRRGPCKHILATQILLDQESPEDPS